MPSSMARATPRSRSAGAARNISPPPAPPPEARGGPRHPVPPGPPVATGGPAAHHQPTHVAAAEGQRRHPQSGPPEHSIFHGRLLYHGPLACPRAGPSVLSPSHAPRSSPPPRPLPPAPPPPPHDLLPAAPRSP